MEATSRFVEGEFGAFDAFDAFDELDDAGRFEACLRRIDTKSRRGRWDDPIPTVMSDGMVVAGKEERRSCNSVSSDSTRFVSWMAFLTSEDTLCKLMEAWDARDDPVASVSWMWDWKRGCKIAKSNWVRDLRRCRSLMISACRTSH